MLPCFYIVLAYIKLHNFEFSPCGKRFVVPYSKSNSTPALLGRLNYDLLAICAPVLWGAGRYLELNQYLLGAELLVRQFNNELP